MRFIHPILLPILLIILAASSCSTPPPVSREPVEEVFDSVPVAGITDETFRNVEGFIKLEPAEEVENTVVTLLNQDGSTYFAIDHQGNIFQDSAKSYPLFFNRSVNKTIYNMLNIKEIAPEYRLYHFLCTRESESYYEVCVDECYQVFRYLRKNNMIVKFYPVEEYVKSAFVRPKNRKIYTNPEARRSGWNTGENFYKVVEMKDDWAFVDCLATGCDCQYDAHNQKGWIRWRKGKELAVDFAWICESSD